MGRTGGATWGAVEGVRCGSGAAATVGIYLDSLVVLATPRGTGLASPEGLAAGLLAGSSKLAGRSKLARSKLVGRSKLAGSSKLASPGARAEGVEDPPG